LIDFGEVLRKKHAAIDAFVSDRLGTPIPAISEFHLKISISYTNGTTAPAGGFIAINTSALAEEQWRRPTGVPRGLPLLPNLEPPILKVLLACLPLWKASHQ
jgi:hypothetical protein